MYSTAIPMRFIAAVFALSLLPAAVAVAQTDDSYSLSTEENSNKGYLKGSFETNTTWYHEDERTNASVPDSHWGSNNYLKLDYYKGKFSAGIQMEAYEPAIVGYPSELDGFAFSNYYAAWQDDDFSITAGSFYDQFGSGLLFRTWEDRALGLNNALIGARFTYHYKDIVHFKAMWGMPRFGMEWSKTQVKGADVSFAVSSLAGWNNVYLALEGSAMDRYEAISVDLEESGGKPNTFGWSGRLNLETGGFFLKGEYVDSGDKYYNNPYITSATDPMYLTKRGNAQLIETGYNGHGLGLNLTARRIEWMDSKILRDNSSTSNMLNYVPAMCTQYTYLLTTLHPYTSRTGDLMGNFVNSGEIGGQLDVFYHIKRGTALGGKRGMKLHANFSTYYTIAEEGTAKAGNLLYRDLSIDVEKQWTRAFKMTLLWSMQEYNPSYGANKSTYLSNIFVADLLYKFTSKISARLELQYLTTHEDQKDWMAALLELNFAPNWSVYGSDMVNHGQTGTHYYNVGVSYAKSRVRLSLAYGRYKAGYICSGGVCRAIPAYTGANFTITTSF